MTESEGLSHHLKHIVERLLQQDIPDQDGVSGNIHYQLTTMKIGNIHLPCASLHHDTITARRGEITITGRYQFHYGRLLSGEGDFEIGIHGLTLFIKLPARYMHRHNGHNNRRLRSTNSNSSTSNVNNETEGADHDTITRFVRHGNVECKIGTIKTKFHGGSARLCKLLARMFSGTIRTQFEVNTAEYVKNLFYTEEDKCTIGLMALFAINTDEEQNEEEESHGFISALRRFVFGGRSSSG